MQNQKVNTGREALWPPFVTKAKQLSMPELLIVQLIKIKLVVEIIVNIIVNIVKIIVE